VYVIRIVGDSFFRDTLFSDQYVEEYDPERDGISADGRIMQCHLVTTPSIRRARKFDSILDATDFYMQVSRREPIRYDGRLNRPLTYFTVDIRAVSEFVRITP
jgi:hypothetical protein